jgi:hypothetical protein
MTLTKPAIFRKKKLAQLTQKICLEKSGLAQKQGLLIVNTLH